MQYWLKFSTRLYFSVIFNGTFLVKIMLKCSHLFQYNHCTTSAFKCSHRMRVQGENQERMLIYRSNQADIGNEWLGGHWMIRFCLSVAVNEVVMMGTSVSNRPGYDTSCYAVPMWYNSISSAQRISCLINCTNDIVQHFTLSDRRLGWSNVQPKIDSYKNSVRFSQDTICNMSNYKYLLQTIMNSLNWKQCF